MADNIVVYDQDLQACAREYTQALETLNEAVREYNQALEALRSDWTGRAFAIMSGHVANLTSKIMGSFERVTDAIKELGDVANIFNENEDKLLSRMKNQDTGTKSLFVG